MKENKKGDRKTFRIRADQEKRISEILGNKDLHGLNKWLEKLIDWAITVHDYGLDVFGEKAKHVVKNKK